MELGESVPRQLRLGIYLFSFVVLQSGRSVEIDLLI